MKQLSKSQINKIWNQKYNPSTDGDIYNIEDKSIATNILKKDLQAIKSDIQLHGNTYLLNFLDVGCTCGLIYTLEDTVLAAFEKIQIMTHRSNNWDGNRKTIKKEMMKYEIDIDNNDQRMILDLITYILMGKGFCTDKGGSFTIIGQWFYNNVVYKMVNEKNGDDGDYTGWLNDWDTDFNSVDRSKPEPIDLSLNEHPSYCYCIELNKGE